MRRQLVNLGMTTLTLITVAVTALLIVSAFVWLVYNTEPHPACGIAATSNDC